MKIAIILNSFPEISEKFLLNHIVGALEAGQDITVFAAHRPMNPVRHELFDRHKVHECVRYVDIPRNLWRRVIAFPPLFFRLLFRNPRAACEALNIPKYKTVARNVKLLYFGLTFATDTGYDLVHCHFGPNGLVGAYLKTCGFVRALVTTFHGSDINTYPARFGSDVYSHLYRTADSITANTEFTKSKIMANGCDPEVITVIPVGLVLADFDNIDRSRVRPHSVLTVGRLEEKKGHHYALEAIASLIPSIPDIHYFIAGDGSLRPSLERRAAELGIKAHVTFLGVVTGDQVRSLYEMSEIFTLPSVTASNGDMEGQGLVLQEAQMCMLPVVTTRHNGIPDGLIDGKTGFLVPEKDPEALADRMSYLLGNSEIGRAMGAEGRSFVSTKYDVRALTSAFAALYARILDQ